MTEQPSFEVARWKRPPPASQDLVFSRSFLVVLVLACTLIALYAAAGLWLIRTHPSWPWAQVLAAGFLILILGVPLFVAVRRKGAVSGPQRTLLRSSNVPPYAIAALIGIRSDSAPLARDVGWVWIHREWLCMEGVHFDFRLRRSDVLNKIGASRALGAPEPFLLKMPKGFPALRLSVTPVTFAGDRFVRSSEALGRLAKELERWEEASPPAEASLYPPLLGVQGKWSPVELLPWIGPSLLVGATVAAMLFISRSYLPAANPWTTLGLSFFSALAVFWLSLVKPLNILLIRAYNAKVRRAWDALGRDRNELQEVELYYISTLDQDAVIDSWFER